MVAATIIAPIDDEDIKKQISLIKLSSKMGNKIATECMFPLGMCFWLNTETFLAFSHLSIRTFLQFFKQIYVSSDVAHAYQACS